MLGCCADQVVLELRTVFTVADNREVRIWHKYMSKQHELLPKWELTIRDSGLFSGQVIVVEEKNADGTWPMQLKQCVINYCSTHSMSYV